MGSLKALLGLLVVVGAAYVGFMFIPPYFNNYQLKDDVQTLAKFAPVANKSEEDVRQEVIKKAKGYDINLAPEQIHVTREGQSMSIQVDYNRTVDLVGGKQVVLEFHNSTK